MPHRHFYPALAGLFCFALSVFYIYDVDPVYGETPELGTINFPNSGSASAQAPFLTGLKALYSFEFADAVEAFQAAEKADPDFALAYWGEAMAYNHPLWNEQDTAAARNVLNRFSPSTLAQKAPPGKERGLVEAVMALYGEGDKLARDRSYADAMKQLSGLYPQDDEIATLYALSLLGTVRPGDPGFRSQMQAAAIAQRVFAKNPNHPGAAHFIIHAFDDPEHAPLGLPAARAYAQIAPAAPHALHMPSHIFVQLGMWEDVVKSNIAAYAAGAEQIKRKNLPHGPDDLHPMTWLAYGYLQLGKFDDARRVLDTARQLAQEDKSKKVRDHYASLQARYVIETQRWKEMPLAQNSEKENSEKHAPQNSALAPSGAHMAHAEGGNATVHFVTGISAAKLGNLKAAARAETALKMLREQAENGPNGSYRAKPLTVMEKELGAVIALRGHDMEMAERLFKEATALEKTLDPPSGPAEPMKPSFELYGEMLLDAHRPQEAAEQFKEALLRMPNRRLSVQGLARAQEMQNAQTIKK